MASPLAKLQSVYHSTSSNVFSSAFKYLIVSRSFTGIKGSALKPNIPITLPINPNNRTTWDLLVNLRNKIKKSELSKEDIEAALQSALQKNDTVTAKEIVMEQLRVKKGVPNIEAFNKILSGLVIEKKWIEMDVLNSLIRNKKVAFTAETYEAIIHSHRMRHNLNTMYQLVEVMKKEKLAPTPNIYKEILEELVFRSTRAREKKKRGKQLHQLFTGLFSTNFSFSLDLLESSLKAAYTFSDYPLIGKLWNTIKSMNFVPSVESYNIRLLSALHTKQFRAAMLLFEDMKKAGVSPSTHTYEILLRCRSITKLKADLSTFIETLLNEMKERKVPIDTSIHNAIIQCYARRAYFDKASQYIHYMKDNNIPFDNQTPCAILPSIRNQFILDEQLGRKTNELLRRVRHLRDKKGTRYQPLLNPVDLKALLHVIDLLPKYRQASKPMKKRPNAAPIPLVPPKIQK